MDTPARKKAVTSSARKVRRYRARMRAKGMRCVQLWVPDTRTAAFRSQAKAEALAIAGSSREAEDQAFIDAVSDTEDE